jgi:glycosyltransferase involved in cell wall biosynthesis
LGLTERVTFITEFLPMDDIIALLHQEADLIVLPYVLSGDSGSSGAIRIAMASGKPVLASDIPLFYDVEEEVVKFRVDQIPDLANTIRSVWENQNLQQRVVERALKHVRSETWTQAAKQLLAVYEGEEDSLNTLSRSAATFAHSSAVR